MASTWGRAPIAILGWLAAISACSDESNAPANEATATSTATSASSATTGAGGAGGQGGTTTSSTNATGTGGGGGAPEPKAPTWSRAYPLIAPVHLAADPSDDILAAGGVTGPFDFAGTSFVADGVDGVVVKIASDGTPLWALHLDTDVDIAVRDVAVDSAGGAYVVGQFTGTLTIGVLSATSVDADLNDAFVAKLNPTGVPLWLQAFGSTSYQSAHCAAVDGAGNLVLAGAYAGDIDFGGGPLPPASEYNVFVAALDPSGAHVWSDGYAGANQFSLANCDVAVDAGGVTFAGSFYVGEVDLGGGPLVSQGDSDVLLARFDAAGSPLWSDAYGGPQNQFIGGLALHGGSAILGGSTAGVANFGGGDVTPTGSEDAFVAVYGSAGDSYVPMSIDLFGSMYSVLVAGLSGDASGHVALTGHFNGGLDFGCGMVPFSMTSDAAFVGVLDAQGGCAWSRGFPSSTGYSLGQAVAFDSQENLVVALQVYDVIDLGAGQIGTASAPSLALASFAP